MCVFCLRYGRLIAIAGLQTDRLEMVSAPVWYMGCWKFLSEACVRRCIDRLKVGEKIENSEAQNTPMC